MVHIHRVNTYTSVDTQYDPGRHQHDKQNTQLQMFAAKTEIIVLITNATIFIIVNTFFITMTTILINSLPHHIDHLLLSKAKKAVGGLC